MLSGGTEALTGTNLEKFLQGVRDLIVIGLESSELPDATLRTNVYFQAAELDVIRKLDTTMNDYDDKLATDFDFKSRAEVAIANRMAAKVLPALPQIVEQKIQGEDYRYSEFDIKERISLLLSTADDAIAPDLPSVGDVIFSEANRRVCF